MDFLLPQERDMLYYFFGEAPPKKETKIERLKNFTKREDVRNAVGKIKTLPTKGQCISRKVSARTKEWRKLVKDLSHHGDTSTAVTQSTSTGSSVSSEPVSHANDGVDESNQPGPTRPKPSPFSMSLSCLGSTITCGNACECIPDEDEEEGIGSGLFGALAAMRDQLLCKSACSGDSTFRKCVEFQMCRNVVFEDGDADDELTLTWDCSSIKGCAPFHCGDNSFTSGASLVDDDSIISLDDAKLVRRSIVPPLALLVYAGKEETCVEVGDPDLLDAYHDALVSLANGRQVGTFDETDGKLHPLVLAHILEQGIEIELSEIQDQHLAIAYVTH